MTNDRPLVDLEKALELLQRETNSLHVVVVGKIKSIEICYFLASSFPEVLEGAKCITKHLVM